MKPFFEKVEYAPEDVILPTRSTSAAAWYDFFASEDVLVPSLFKALQKWEFLKPTFVPTHIKAFMPDDMVLQIELDGLMLIIIVILIMMGIFNEFFGIWLQKIFW